MEQFEKQFDDLDVQAGYMDAAMSASTSTTMPMDQVDALMRQVAEERGIEISLEMASPVVGPLPSVSAPNEEEKQLANRLAKLRNPN